MKFSVRLRPVAFIAVLLLAWHFAAKHQRTHILPGPLEVAAGIAELMQRGLLLKYVVASLFRVTWVSPSLWRWPYRWDWPCRTLS
jgi:NitT/TauT family transport system permease protein